VNEALRYCRQDRPSGKTAYALPHTYAYIHIHIHIRTELFWPPWTHIHICTELFWPSWTHTYAYTYAPSSSGLHGHTCAYIHIHIHIRTEIFWPSLTHTYANIHIRIRTELFWPSLTHTRPCVQSLLSPGFGTSLEHGHFFSQVAKSHA
jgi:hypothetical protein